MLSTRRVFLHRFIMGGASVAALGAGLLRSAKVFAAWPETAFNAETYDASIAALFEGEAPETSDAIKIKAPDIAENGAVVPVSVKTDLANVESISIFVPKNPAPLVARFNLTADSVADVATRIKMGQTSNVIAIVRADGKLLMATQEVKVTVGGCGG